MLVVALLSADNLYKQFGHSFFKGAQWLSGRVLDSRPRGHGFEPYRHHCMVVLEQDTFLVTGSTQEDPSLFN